MIRCDVLNMLNIRAKLNKLLTRVDTLTADAVNKDILIVIKDTDDVDFYYIDDEGKKIPISEVIAYKSFYSRGKLITPNIVKIEVVDNSYLESCLYDDDLI